MRAAETASTPWRLLAVALVCGLGAAIAGQPLDAREMRIWTDPHGNQIEASLEEVHPDRVVLVRRDGQRFSTALDHFSEADQRYIAAWARERSPRPEDFEEIETAKLDRPDRYRIENVERRRPGPGEPLEPAAIKMVLDYHGIDYDEGLVDRISVREIHRDRFIRPRDLTNALRNLPVETEVITSWDPYADDHEETWEFARETLKLAISMDLPVLVGYRPLMEIDTLELVGVAVGYDRRNFEIIEPTGSRHPARFHVRDFKYMFAYAMILFPTFEPPRPPVEEMRLTADFLNRVSATIMESPDGDAEALTERLRDRGIRATVRDVNRSDIRNMLGQTRSFARRGGLPLIDATLDHGQVAVVPREYRRGETGFVLIYGRVDDAFAAVEFFTDRTFDRRLLSRPELARRWLTRDNRTYRLDLIQIEPPPMQGVSG